MEPKIKQNLLSMRIIYSALIIGSALSCAILYILRKEINTGGSIDKTTGTIIFIASNLFIIFDVAIGFFIIRKILSFEGAASLQAKLNKYRTALIIRGAIFEAGCIILMICYLITTNIVLAFEALILLGVMIYFFPSRQRMESEIGHEINIS